MTRSSKKDKLWKIWSDGLHNLGEGSIDHERASRLIPISFTLKGKEECAMIFPDLGEVSLTIAEVSKYGVIKDDKDSLYKYAIYKL